MTRSCSGDAAGRTTSVVTSAGTTTLTYDYESRITGITYPGGATNSFTYNGLDTRVGKVDSAGTSTYKRDGAYVTDSVLADGSAAFTPTVSERRSSATTYFHSGLKNNDRQSNTSQTVTATKQYDAYGMLVSNTGTWKGPFSYAGPFGYQEDGDSGLKLLGHRYYDPSTGRFLTRDFAMDGRNWYAYSENNPITGCDPMGLWNFGRWLYTGDGNSSDEVYDASLEQAANALRVWTKHFLKNNADEAPAVAAVIGPTVPKDITPIIGIPRKRMIGEEYWTSGLSIIARLIKPGGLKRGLKMLCRKIKKVHKLIWLYFEVGVAWQSTYDTMNDPDLWLEEEDD